MGRESEREARENGERETTGYEPFDNRCLFVHLREVRLVCRLGCGVWDFGSLALGFGVLTFEVWGFEFGGLGFRVLGFGVSSFRIWEWDFEFWVLGVGSEIGI